jgi:hypothetical protein
LESVLHSWIIAKGSKAVAGVVSMTGLLAAFGLSRSK